MIRFKYLVIMILVTQGVISCSKSFLDVPVTREIVAEEYLTDLTAANELLNGIYFLIAKDIYDGQVVAYADVAADNAKDVGNLLPVQYNWSMKTSDRDSYDENMNRLWLHGYHITRSCNFLIEHIDGLRTENPTVADDIKGQAYALRALVHFNLVNVFAQPYGYSNDAAHPGIPYDTVYDPNEQVTRATVANVYENIIADFNRALQLLQPSANNRAAINVHAVKGLLSRVHLFKGDVAAANHLAIEVASLVPLMASGDYPQKLFTQEDTESLFWLPPATPSNSGFTFYQGAYFARSAQVAATADLAALIGERQGDLRNTWLVDTAGMLQVRKFPVNAVPGLINPFIAYYQTVIRSSEMYLNAAETYALLGQEDSARIYLDAIRQRADISAPVSSASGTALLDAIYKERRKELCFENLRLFDLLRWKKDISRTDVAGASPTSLTYPSDQAIAPIPLTDVQGHGLQQNSGY
jgi:hypothetical protein